MHFTRNGAFGPGRQPVLVLERGEGPYVFDTRGQPLLRRPVGAVLLADRLLLRRGAGDRGGRAQMAKLPFATIGAWRTRPRWNSPTASRARAARARARVLHQRRRRVGRVRMEARPPVPRRHRRREPHQGDRAQGRLPRRHPGRAGAHRRRRLQGAVRRRPRSTSATCRRPTRFRLGEDPRFARRRATTTRPSPARCSTRSRRSCSRRARTRSRCSSPSRSRTPAAASCPPDGYWQGLRELADRYGFLIVADEVITAFGRLGEWFGSTRVGARPT